MNWKYAFIATFFVGICMLLFTVHFATSLSNPNGPQQSDEEGGRCKCSCSSSNGGSNTFVCYGVPKKGDCSWLNGKTIGDRTYNSCVYEDVTTSPQELQ